MGHWGRKIRALYGGGRENVHADEELRWFLKDREMHVQEVVRPALAAGSIVVLDRYYHSTIAYQGARGGFSTEELERKNREIAPAPDLTVILDLEVRESLRRVCEERGDRANTFENEQYLQQVKSIYDAMQGPGIVHIDAGVPREQLAEDVWQAIRTVLTEISEHEQGGQ